MKFSVIIPVYNSAQFLRKCIGSIVDQEYQDYELILVDDGSTDASNEICQEYADKYNHIQLIRQENRGPSAARNEGIENASGDYLTFVDSDDWVMPDYFQTLENAVDQNPDIVFFGILHGPDPEVLAVFPESAVSSQQQIVAFLSQNYYHGDFASCVNKAYSKWLFADGMLRFPAATVVEEDLQFVLQAVDRSQTLVSLSAPLCYYNRRESGSVTTKYNPVKFDCKLQAYETELMYARKWGSAEFEQIFDDNYLSYISASINNLMYAECRLTGKQKLNEIKRFYNAEPTLSCIKRSKGKSLRSKVMYWLIRMKLYRISYLLHYFTFHIRRR